MKEPRVGDRLIAKNWQHNFESIEEATIHVFSVNLNYIEYYWEDIDYDFHGNPVWKKHYSSFNRSTDIYPPVQYDLFRSIKEKLDKILE